MTYNLSTLNQSKQISWRERFFDITKVLSSYLEGERSKLILVGIAVVFNTLATVFTPFILAYAIDNYVLKKDLDGLLKISLVLGVVYVVSVITSYLQARIIGRLSQRTLYRLRQNLFAKIQGLPLAFFIQNKSGDLISRLNNDTDKLNQFLSESVLRFISIMLSIVGIGVVIFFINVKMSLLLLASTIFILIFNKVFSNWVKRTNKESLEATGNLTAEINEALANYKTIVVFNKQDYLEEKVSNFNKINYSKMVVAQIGSALFRPLYDLAGNFSQVLVLAVGIYLITQGEVTVGVLIGFLTYTQKFYEPLRILGSVWGSFQSALAAWGRVQEILSLDNNLKVIPVSTKS